MTGHQIVVFEPEAATVPGMPRALFIFKDPILWCWFIIAAVAAFAGWTAFAVDATSTPAKPASTLTAATWQRNLAEGEAAAGDPVAWRRWTDQALNTAHTNATRSEEPMRTLLLRAHTVIGAGGDPYATLDVLAADLDRAIVEGADANWPALPTRFDSPAPPRVTVATLAPVPPLDTSLPSPAELPAATMPAVEGQLTG